MSEPKRHTPEPWMVFQTPDGAQLRVDSVTGVCVAVCFNAPKPNEISEERLANARLISAAPELLATLKNVRFELTEYYKAVPFHHEFLAAIDAAIAKAEGRAE